MKRWSAALAALSVVVLAGCARPAGADGNLVDDWPAHGRAVAAPPPAGACHIAPSGFAQNLTSKTLVQVGACTDPHSSETIFIGAFSGALADAGSPPAPDELDGAYGECDRAAKEFLGDDWHNGRLVLLVFAPTPDQWRGDGRFFRCDLTEVRSDAGRIVERPSTLKDALRGDRPLAHGCGTSIGRGTEGGWEDLRVVPCSTAHDLEYAGFITVSERAYPEGRSAIGSSIGVECAARVASYLGMAVAELLAHRQVNYGWWMVGKDRWAIGDRSARCYVLLEPGVTASRSLKDMGNKPI